MATVFMTVYGKQGLRELAEQNLAKAHYLAGKLKPRFCGQFFNEFVVQLEGKTPDAVNKALLKKKIIGGLPLGRFYPELADSMLLCATEMTQARGHGRGGGGAAHDHEKSAPTSRRTKPLLFERSSPGKKAYQLPELDVPAVDPAEALGAENVRAEIEGFPEVSEVEAIRHFTRLSTWNYAIDLRHVSAGLLHHEVQPADQRAGGAHRGPGVGASLSAGSAVAGLPWK